MPTLNAFCKSTSIVCLAVIHCYYSSLDAYLSFFSDPLLKFFGDAIHNLLHQYIFYFFILNSQNRTNILSPGCFIRTINCITLACLSAERRSGGVKWCIWGDLRLILLSDVAFVHIPKVVTFCPPRNGFGTRRSQRAGAAVILEHITQSEGCCNM